jgi:hypothetical protein
MIVMMLIIETCPLNSCRTAIDSQRKTEKLNGETPVPDNLYTEKPITHMNYTYYIKDSSLEKWPLRFF